MVKREKMKLTLGPDRDREFLLNSDHNRFCPQNCLTNSNANITLEMMSDSVHIIYAGLPNEIQNSTLIFRSNLWRFVRSGDLSITSETRAGISQAGPSRPSLTFQSKITPSQINQTAIKIFVTLIKIFATFIEQ